jgi:hypothetical protein
MNKMQMNRIGDKSLSTERRHWITFRQKTLTQDSEGGFIESWTDFLSCFAAVYPYRADQIFNFRSVNVEATHLIKTGGYLQLPTKTKWVGQTWVITWTGIIGAYVQLHYQINGGAWVLISASEINGGSYSWTIPIAAIGRRGIVRVKGV